MVEAGEIEYQHFSIIHEISSISVAKSKKKYLQVKNAADLTLALCLQAINLPLSLSLSRLH